MRRSIIIAALLAFFPFAVRAQQVVIDPSQIAASATNAANQIDYMLDQLGELAHLGDQMNTMREHIDNVFGEDGIGGKAISVMQDLGTLARLTESYNSTIKMTEAYLRQMQEMERYKLSDANMMLSYLNSMKTQVELAIETAKKILNTMGFSKAEKKKENLTRAIVNLVVGVLILALIVVLVVKFRSKIPAWWKALKSECGKIVWCPKDKLKKNTLVVIIIIVLLAVVIGVLDFAFSKGILLLGDLVH